MALLYYVSYVAILVAFAFVTLSLASGLLYLSELIEEHSRFAKVVGQRGIYAIIALHVIFYMTESLPLLQTVFSIICHMVYLQNFTNTWPLISLSSMPFLASCVLVIVDHFSWFFHFARLTQGARHQRYSPNSPAIAVPSFVEIATFFGICVWMAPLFLFLSLSANDNALPMSSGDPGSPSVAKTQFAPSRVSLLRSIFSTFSFVIPGSRPKFSRHGASEGIIAPPSPQPYRTSTDSPLRSPSVSAYQHALSPPRSPGLRSQDFDSKTGSYFKLSTPPRGSASRSGLVNEGVGLGIRRSASSTSMLGQKDD